MKKKIIGICLLLTITLTAGCGNDGTNSSLSASTEASASQEASVSEEIAETSLSVSEEVIEEENKETPPENISLKDIYAEHGVKVGTCLTTTMIDTAKYEDIILSQFNSVTMENAMKPDYIFNKQKSIETGELTVCLSDEAVEMLEWAKNNNMAVRGHTLVWYSQTPSWIFKVGFDSNNEFVSRDVMLSRMESYIKQVFDLLEESGYSDLIYAYDVVNEAWMEDGTMRENQNNWYKVIGDDYLWYAFYFADKYAPEHIDLYYNDYNEQYKAPTLAKFVETLVDEEGNYLIDGIGLQAHLYTQDDMNKYLSAVKTLGATGLKLQITELDVSIGAYQKEELATKENLDKQGRYYYNLLKGILDMIDNGEITMDSITFWGFTDSLSWRRSANPLLYSSMGTTKPAYYGAAQLLDFAGFN